MTDLIIIENLSAMEVFLNDDLDPILSQVEEEARKFKGDMTTEVGRKEIASLAFKVAKSKTALDKMGKTLTEDWVRQSKLVNTVRKKTWERLEKLQKEVRQPLTDWENKEKLRVEAHKEKLQELKDCIIFSETPSIKLIEEMAQLADSLYHGDWEEFQVLADDSYNSVSAYLNTLLAETKKQAAEKIELEALRKAAVEREQKERDERIAKDAAEKARRHAEEKAKAEKLKAEKKAAEILAEKEAAIKKATADRVKAEAQVVADKKAAADKAQKELKDAADAARAEAEKKAATERNKILAEKEAEILALKKTAEVLKVVTEVSKITGTKKVGNFSRNSKESVIFRWAKKLGHNLVLSEIEDLIKQLNEVK